MNIATGAQIFIETIVHQNSVNLLDAIKEKAE